MPRKKSLDKPVDEAHNDGMSSNPVKTVPATCACGASFARAIKRGRPQVWCPACLKVPFYERTARPVAAPVAEIPKCGVCGKLVTDGQHPGCYTTNMPEDAAPVVERIVNVNDALDSVRDSIEAAMLVINAEHKVRFAALVASGLAPMDAGAEAMKETQAATLAVYAPHRRKFVTA